MLDLSQAPKGHGKGWRVEKKSCWPACIWCYEAQRRARGRSVYRRATGTEQRQVPLKKTRMMLRYLLEERGYSGRTIARETGYHINTILNIATRTPHRARRRKFVLSGLEAAVEKVYRQQTSESRYASNLVDADRSRRAIQGMMLQGYSQGWISERVDLSPSGLAAINARRRYVRIEHDRELVALARSVGTRPGPSEVARSLSARRGYKPLAFWDDLV